MLGVGDYKTKLIFWNIAMKAGLSCWVVETGMLLF